MSQRKCKTVSFDLDENYESDLLEYAERQDKYFSRYIKRLIAEARARESSGTATGGNYTNQVTVEKILDDRPDAYTMEAMGSFL